LQRSQAKINIDFYDGSLQNTWFCGISAHYEQTPAYFWASWVIPVLSRCSVFWIGFDVCSLSLALTKSP
jgi:hypothetical protein